MLDSIINKTDPNAALGAMQVAWSGIDAAFKAQPGAKDALAAAVTALQQVKTPATVPTVTP